MTFAYPLPWWAIVLVAAAILGLAVTAYLRSSVVLSARERLPLIVLRALTLSAVVVMLMRPVAPLPPAAGEQGVVAVLVDTSRSMSLADGRSSRLATAVTAARERILPDLAKGFSVETYSVGERVARADLEQMSASDRVSSLTAAVREIRERYRDRSLAGIVLLSDGGETGEAAVQASTPVPGPPVVAVGVGSPDRTGRPRDPQSDDRSVGIRRVAGRDHRDAGRARSQRTGIGAADRGRSRDRAA